MTKDEVKEILFDHNSSPILAVIRKKGLPVIITKIEETDSKRGNFTIWYEDLKLRRNGLTHTKNYVPIYETTYKDLSTQAMDLAAKIPSNASDEVRVKARLAWCFYTSYICNILYSFQDTLPANRNNEATIANAKQWYDTLRK